MTNRPSILGLIVARGGSKSIPRKNIRPAGGKPLIAHTIEAALASGCLDRVILSTDDPEIAEVAEKYGAEVPFMRPAEMAGDASPVIDASLHAFQWLEKNEHYFPMFGMLLPPTSPLRTAGDIQKAVALAVERNADAVVGVTEADRHPYLMKKIDGQGRLSPFMDTPLSESRRQDLPPVYAINGAIYLVKRTVLQEQRSWCPAGALAYVMPAERSLDVDTPWDLTLVDLVLEGKK